MKKLFIFFLLLTFLHSCKEDCPEEIDPCASFPEKMEIIVEWPDYYGPNYNRSGLIKTTDETFAVEQLLQFSTNFSYDSIQWKFGSDPSIGKGDKVQLIFSNAVGPVEVKCIAYRPVNTNCFGPADDGVDTLIKTLNFKEWLKSPLFGTYRGVNEGETDSFNITLGYDSVYNQALGIYQYDNLSVFYLGLPQNTTSRRFIGIEYYEMFGYNNGNNDNIRERYTYIRMEPSRPDRITIKWRVTDTKQDMLFTGKRIN
jgi:hypothetical protein